jgi:hypothetical protein
VKSSQSMKVLVLTPRRVCWTVDGLISYIPKYCDKSLNHFTLKGKS